MDSSAELFPPDEPPTFPQRTRSNEPIRTDVIQPMLKQHVAFRKVGEVLDEAIRCAKRAVKEGSIPPPE